MLTVRQRFNQLKKDYEALVELYLETPEPLTMTSSLLGEEVSHEELIRRSTEADDLRVRLAPQEFVWRTSDGRDLRPRDMDDEHLRNCVSYTQRRLASAFGTVKYLRETEKMATAYVEFLKEARGRGIRV